MGQTAQWIIDARKAKAAEKRETEVLSLEQAKARRRSQRAKKAARRRKHGRQS